MGYGIPRTAAIHTCKSQINDLLQQVRNVTSGEPNTLQEAKVLLDTQLSVLQHRMSRSAGPIRVLSLVDKAFEEAKQQQASLATLTGIPSVYLPKVLRLRHMVVAQTWYLYAIKTYLERGGGSRGSYLVVSEEGQAPHPLLATYSMVPEERALQSFVQVVCPMTHMLSKADGMLVGESHQRLSGLSGSGGNSRKKPISTYSVRR
jgi:hypothetical protein